MSSFKINIIFLLFIFSIFLFLFYSFYFQRLVISIFMLLGVIGINTFIFRAYEYTNESLQIRQIKQDNEQLLVPNLAQPKRDDEQFLVPNLVQTKPDDEQFLMPNLVHYIWFRWEGRNHTFTFIQYLAILSASRFIKPDAILFHTDHPPGTIKLFNVLLLNYY